VIIFLLDLSSGSRQVRAIMNIEYDLTLPCHELIRLPNVTTSRTRRKHQAWAPLVLSSSNPSRLSTPSPARDVLSTSYLLQSHQTTNPTAKVTIRSKTIESSLLCSLADLYPSHQSVTMRLLVEALGIDALCQFFLFLIKICVFFGHCLNLYTVRSQFPSLPALTKRNYISTTYPYSRASFQVPLRTSPEELPSYRPSN
jgi:hypothetical protein